MIANDHCSVIKDLWCDRPQSISILMLMLIINKVKCSFDSEWTFYLIPVFDRFIVFLSKEMIISEKSILCCQFFWCCGVYSFSGVVVFIVFLVLWCLHRP